MFGQWRMPLLQTPYMLNAAQDDKFELPVRPRASPSPLTLMLTTRLSYSSV